MKRLGVFALALSLAGVAGCDDEPASPSNLPVVLTAQLSPANEVPPVGNAENTGRGAVQITIHPTYDAAGDITGGTADFEHVWGLLERAAEGAVARLEASPGAGAGA